MRLFSTRLYQAVLLVLILVATGCGKAAPAPETRLAAAAAAAPTVTGTADAGPLAGLAAAAGGFPVPSSSAVASSSADPFSSAASGAQGQSGAPGVVGAQAVAGAQGTSAIPGTDAAIQRWFLDTGAVKVRFNDALLLAWKGVAQGNPAGCQPLDAGTRALSTVLPTLEGLSPAGKKLAAAMRTPLATFAAAATACLSGDFAAARVALDSGAIQQAEAQETVDEILDGDV